MSELQDLWQSAAPRIDTQALIERLRRQNRALRRVNRISFGTSIVSLIIIFMLEIIGRLPTGGWLSAAGIVGFAWSVWKYRRDKARLVAAYSKEPAKLLPFIIQRTRAARNLGLSLLFLSPLGIGVGYLLGHFTDDSKISDSEAGLLALLLVPAFAFIGALMLYGYRLARRKNRELVELIALRDELQSSD